MGTTTGVHKCCQKGTSIIGGMCLVSGRVEEGVLGVSRDVDISSTYRKCEMSSMRVEEEVHPPSRIVCFEKRVDSPSVREYPKRMDISKGEISLKKKEP